MKPNKKLQLNDLNVQSFVTEEDKQKNVKGGTVLTVTGPTFCEVQCFTSDFVACSCGILCF